MSRLRRFRFLAIVLFVAAGLYGVNHLSSTDATTFSPRTTIDLSTTTPGGNPDTLVQLDIDFGDSNFAGSGAGIVTFLPGAWCVATHDNDCSTVDGSNNPTGPAVPTGAIVGANAANTKLALQTSTASLNSSCNQLFPVAFTLLEAEPDDSAGTISTSGASNIFLPLTLDADADGIPNHADLWPSYLSTLLDPDGGGALPPLFPEARYSADLTVAGTEVILQFLVYAPGALQAFPGEPWQSFPASLGHPVLTVLQDPQQANNGSIADFCSDLDSLTTTLGVTLDNPDTAGPDESGSILHKNSTITSGIGGTGTHIHTAISQPGRDKDADGIENAMDTCPNTTNLDGDPRTNNGADNDGLDSACDITAAVCDANNTTDPLPKECDADDDGWANRLDDCPQVANGAAQGIADVSPGTAVSDGGPPTDSIGLACDAAPTVSDGHYHQVTVKDFACNGVADADDDGWCDARESFVGTGTGKACANDSTPDNEADDGIPVDFDDNQSVNIVDRARIVAEIIAGTNSARFDLDSNGFVAIADRAAVVASIGYTCG